MILCNTSDSRRPDLRPGDRPLYSGFHGETRDRPARQIINGRVIGYGESGGPSRRPIADLGVDSNKVKRGYEGPLLHLVEDQSQRLDVREQAAYRQYMSEQGNCGAKGADLHFRMEPLLPFYREDCPGFHDASARMRGAQVPDYTPHLPQPYAVGAGRRYGVAPHLVGDVCFDPHRPVPIEHLDRALPQHAPRAGPQALYERGDHVVADLSVPVPPFKPMGRHCAGQQCIAREPGDYGGV